MDSTYTTAGREWEAGERVIVVSTHGNATAPRVLRIHSVADKSFVVDGERYRKDKLSNGVPAKVVGSGWGQYGLRVYPMDHPDAPWLLAQRAVYKQWRQVHSAQTEWDRLHSIVNAEVLRGELAAWIEARKVFDREAVARDQRERDGR